MIRITPQAAEQIRAAAQQAGTEELALRIAAREGDDGSIEYGMGFDEVGELDIHVPCEGVDVVVAPVSEPLLHGAVLDFVEIEPGDFRFIFLNPNDPYYERPHEDAGSAPQGCGGCGSGGSCGGG